MASKCLDKKVELGGGCSECINNNGRSNAMLPHQIVLGGTERVYTYVTAFLVDPIVQASDGVMLDMASRYLEVKGWDIGMVLMCILGVSGKQAYACEGVAEEHRVANDYGKKGGPMGDPYLEENLLVTRRNTGYKNSSDQLQPTVPAISSGQQFRQSAPANSSGNQLRPTVPAISSDQQLRQFEMATPKDPAWKYNDEIVVPGDGAKKGYKYLKWKFCNKEITGGVKRAKEHLAQTHKGVSICPIVPPEVKDEIVQYLSKFQDAKLVSDYVQKLTNQ
ncbi:hypothetical protein OSB04_029329 [Centaurea solstitialis]|uniref:Uncharacterized protein n=1 Tax=Centaurea solstitialis TaxID=347529 RepID=A0AA38SPY2_9ASTR|nr:hypothetical protein OSB04_029329 [Centaurea solstitialis]